MWFACFLLNSSAWSTLTEPQEGKRWIDKRILRLRYHKLPFCSQANNPNVLTRVIIQLNVNALTMGIDDSAYIVTHIWHQMHTKPQGTNGSRAKSRGRESEAVIHPQSLATFINDLHTRSFYKAQTKGGSINPRLTLLSTKPEDDSKKNSALYDLY